SLDQVNLAAVVGALAGFVPGLIAGAVSLIVNLVTRKSLRLPEQLAYGLWVLALVLTTTTFTVGTADAVSGSVMAAGAFALIGAVYWWVYDLANEDPANAVAATPAGTGAGTSATATTATAASGTDVDGDDEPV